MIPQRDTKINKLKYGLYVVSTPIGNLRDITLRAIEILKQSDYILCEDTRVSKNLLKKYNIKSQLISNHKFNESKNISKIIEILDSKKIVSIISDAGTPNISDPGSIIVNECIKHILMFILFPVLQLYRQQFQLAVFLKNIIFMAFSLKKIKILKKILIFYQI